MPRFILENQATGLYFTEPLGPSNSEWSDNPRKARQWADLDSAQQAVKVWHMIHGEQLTVQQFVSSPGFHSVTAPGTPTLSVSHGTAAEATLRVASQQPTAPSLRDGVTAPGTPTLSVSHG